MLAVALLDTNDAETKAPLVAAAADEFGGLVASLGVTTAPQPPSSRAAGAATPKRRG